ncbi:MAG: ComEC/Rec2 family competence protein [Verrucomicrobiota bacterium]
MKWPLAPVVLCLAGGIVAGDAPGVHGVMWWLLLAMLAGAVRWRKHRQASLLGLLVFMAGWGNLRWHQEVFSERDLRVVLHEEADIVTLEGTLAEAPRERFVETKQGRKLHFSSLLEVQRLQRAGTWEEAEGRVFIRTPAPPPENLQRNQVVQVTGGIAPPNHAMIPGGFDFREYLAREGIHYQLHTQGLKDWQIPTTNAPAPVTARFHGWAMDQLQGGLPPADENVMLLQAMGLGWKAGLLEEVQKSFMQSGTLHIFAISGLHVALMAVMLVELLRGAGLPRWICGAVLIPLLWFYTAATGWQASAVRSAIMMTVIGAGWMLERPANLLNSLAAAGLIILALDPQQLFQAGFQLSFMVVLSMGLLLPPVEEWRKRIFRPDPLLPEELRPRWQRWLDWPVRFVTMNATTSFAAWLGSLPLIAYYFHMVTPVSLIANLVLVPVSSLALMASFGSLLTAWCPPVADLFNHAAWFLMNFMVASSEWFASWPGAWWPVQAPGPGIFLSYYVWLLSVFAWEWKSRWRWRIAGGAGLGLAVLVALGWQAQQSELRLTVLDTGGGEALVFEGGSQYEPLVIDAGSAAGYGLTLAPYLQNRAIRQLPRLLLTHGDAQHVGGAPELSGDYAVRELVTSPVPSRSPGYRHMVTNWSTGGKVHQTVTNGSRVGPWQVWHPAATDRFSKGDDNAVVLRGEFMGVRVLLLSDLGRQGQKTLRERHPDLRAEIVVTGIPAKEEPLMDELLAVIQPEVVIVTCALQPAHEQAGPELRARLEQGPWTTYYVSDHGSVTLDFTPAGCEVRAMRREAGVLVRPGN